jgi:hypothetical protein
MARRKVPLAEQVQHVVAEALDRVKALVRESLTEELDGLIHGGRFLGAPQGTARRVGAKRGKGRRAGVAADRGRGRTSTTEVVGRLEALVRDHGTISPKDARRRLGLTAPQMQAAARAARKAGRIKIQGAGPATRYARK